MIIDCNYKDKNKDFSKKAKYVNGYKNFRRSVVENRNNYYLTNKKNPVLQKQKILSQWEDYLQQLYTI